MQTHTTITANNRFDNMTIVELQDARQECLRNGQPGGAWVIQNEIERRVAQSERNRERLAAVLAAHPAK